jgi:hypothetical protein
MPIDTEAMQQIEDRVRESVLNWNALERAIAYRLMYALGVRIDDCGKTIDEQSPRKPK